MEGYKEHSINERIADIARTLFGGNISLMARKTFIARNTINSIIKSDGVTPGYDIINKIAEMASPRISLQWLVRGEGDELDIPKDTISEALGHEYGSRITGVYIKYNRDKVDEANRKVIDYILYNKKE